jgi:ubiquinone/menaquinone biosynthesis C-methylase UbiE/CRP-like cAMP-binding protein/GNAT superfamily N-acetyltransferase
MSLIVKLAETEAEKEIVYSLRYQIYIDELNRSQAYADHNKKWIKEPWDEYAFLLYAMDRDEVIGTVRLNLKKDGPMEYEELYSLERFAPFYPNLVSMTTKLLVKESYRNSVAASLLVMTAYEMYRKWGLVFNFIDTRPHLVRLYQQLGFRFYKENINHPEFGNAIPLVIVLDDIEYLKEVRSPFIRIAKKFHNPRAGAEFFQMHFPTYNSIKPLFAMSHENLWDTFYDQIHKDPLEVLSIFSGFEAEEARKLLTQLDLIQYDEGDIVFAKDDESEGMYCILEGQVQVCIPGEKGDIVIAILNQGEIFGELGFVSKIRRTATIRVRNKSKLLLLNQKEFKKLEVNSPSLALKLLTNLFSILVSRFNEKHEALMEARYLLDTIFLTQESTKAMNPEIFKEKSKMTDASEQSKGSYVVDEFADSQGELDRLRFQAKTGFGLEKKMFDTFGIDQNSEVIDVGCGPGFFANEVYQAYQPKKLMGLELDPKLIEIANRELSGIRGVEFVQGSVYDLPLQDSSFDAAYSRFVFQHLDDPDRGVKELKRIVKPGGVAIIEDIDDGLLFLEPEPESYNLVQETSERVQKELGGDRRVGRKLFSMMKKAGFSKISVKYLPVSSVKIGMEAFVFAAFGFKFDHLKRSGASEETVEKAKKEFFALVQNPEAYGSLMLVFAIGKV